MKRSKILEDRPSITIERVPRDILLDIPSRLPVTSLMHLKLLYSVDFSAYNENNIGQTVKRIRVPEKMTPEFEVVGSCNGLICICNSLLRNAIHMNNPFTKDYSKLPEPEWHLKKLQVLIGFGFHPTTKEYKVVTCQDSILKEVNIPPHLEYSLPVQSRVQIFSLVSPSWRSIGELPSVVLNPRPSHVLVNGRLQWLSLRGRKQVLRKLASFDLADKQFREVP
ncbi:unnamed protein product [Dovyalis caffra]|uniref:F-box associated beta-propeller type 1 domain-containing protein n=1 Tax=Dovyalis caffra TaxID=77055 RepID=A0AAV1SDL7_9ROSI|nr:unnamed protein product [Dovyalis caffra]